MRIEVEIRDGINPITALECVKQVIAGEKFPETGKESLTIAGPLLFSLMRARSWYTLVTTERTIAF